MHGIVDGYHTVELKKSHAKRVHTIWLHLYEVQTHTTVHKYVMVGVGSAEESIDVETHERASHHLHGS